MRENTWEFCVYGGPFANNMVFKPNNRKFKN